MEALLHPDLNHAKSENSDHTENTTVTPIPISKYTKALLRSWKQGNPALSSSPVKISVSQTVSFFAFLYEKIRNAVEFREDHLIRRAAIERIIKRKMILNENGRDIAEPLIKELLWARYYENNTIPEEMVAAVQNIIDKYFFIRNELSRGKSSGEQERIATFTLEVLSCEIEEKLSLDRKREAFTNYVYQILRPFIAPFDSGELERDVQVYIAVERAFAHSDNAILRYQLLKLMVADITKVSWKSADKIMPQLSENYQKIDKDLNHPLKDKIRNAIKKQIPPFLILRDVFEQNNQNIDTIMTDEIKLKYSVDKACRKRYDESRTRLRRTAVRSFIYILLTKVIFAFIAEIPYDLYFEHQINYLPVAVNVIFPPILMTVIILTVSIPGDDNTRRVFHLIKGIIDNDPDTLPVTKSGIAVGKVSKSHGIIFTFLFTSLYLLTYFITFGSIIYVLSLLHFSPVSQGIFIFFVTLVTFFAFRVIQITQEYQVVENEGIFSPITDFIFLPIIRVGQFLSGEILARFNALIFIFDFIIEMPFKAIIEVFDEWVHFIKLKKEEII